MTATASRERKTAFAEHEVKEFRDPLKVQIMLPNGHDEGRRIHGKPLDRSNWESSSPLIWLRRARLIPVKPGTTLLTDGHASYPGLSGYRHDPRIVGAMAGHVVLPWSHRAFSLLKRWALGTYHGLRRKHIDTYLNEFVFRYNRRFYRHVSFEALLGLATHQAPTGYWDIIKRDNPRRPASCATPTTYR